MRRFNADQGLLVGWGGFNQAVRAEALGDYFRVRLWDADDLVCAVEREYGRLPPTIRAEIPLKQFWALAPEPAAEGTVVRPEPVRPNGTLPSVTLEPPPGSHAPIGVSGNSAAIAAVFSAA